MSFLHASDRSEPATSSEELREVARQKVRAAMAGLGRAPEVEAPPAPVEAEAEGEVDPLVREAVDRLRARVAQLTAVDHEGRVMTWEQLAAVVVGPLAGRSRDAETVAALLQAVPALPTPPAAPLPLDPVREELLPGGGHRFVFRAADLDLLSEAAAVREDALLSRLEQRFTTPGPSAT